MTVLNKAENEDLKTFLQAQNAIIPILDEIKTDTVETIELVCKTIDKKVF